MTVCLIEPVQLHLEPWELYRALNLGEDAVFLDSSKPGDRRSRFSIIGLEPIYKFVYAGDADSDAGDAFAEIKQLLSEYEVKPTTHLPFVGGAMGYFSYDFGRRLEGVASLNPALYEIPDVILVFYNHVLVYDHEIKTYFVTGVGKTEKAVSAGIDRWIGKINGVPKGPSPWHSLEMKSYSSPPEPYCTRDGYIAAIEKTRQYIEEGDVYITNMTQTFTGEWLGNPVDLYDRLRAINPAPFSAYLPFGDFTVLSSSPERFLKITNGHVETRPIKGTRPRGLTPEEDEENMDELMNSEKDRSELLMIVDLERNDLSKVCKPGSVCVTDLFKVEDYATVFHLVSTVEGEMTEDNTAVDCLKACFPGGSITGAPKIRAMEIIDELEYNRRGIYTGCIGYLGYDGNMDTNIVIRTILLKDGKAHIGVGGGITWESDPEAEYEETLDKAKALFEALGGRHQI